MVTNMLDSGDAEFVGDESVEQKQKSKLTGL